MSRPQRQTLSISYAVHPSGTNNEMEANGLLAVARWLYCHHRTTPIQSFGDSAVIINLALARYRVSAQNLVPALQEIRRLLFGLRLVVLSAVPLEFNTAADGLCNWIMDKADDKIQSLSADSTAWPLPPSVSNHSRWGRCWAILMADYKRVEHLVQNHFVNHAFNESALPDIAEPDTAAPYADTKRAANLHLLAQTSLTSAP
ncbi:Ribonuclease H-like domain [Phytophthora cactorum]|nr:Ribonuclease H-like domain [Phytophthora cactorum]